MLDLLVVAIGFSCFTPGIAIVTLGKVGLQVIMPLFVLYCLAFPLSRLPLPMKTVQWVLANIFGFILSYLLATITGNGGHEAEYLIFQSLLYAGAGVGFGTILVVPRHRRFLLEGYIAGALFSSAVGLVQAILSATFGIVLYLTNNTNFALVRPIGRAAAFTPEASVLATLLLPAFVCVWYERGKPDSLLAPLLRSRFTLCMLLAGLIATRSSMLFLSPLFLLAAALFSADNWKAFVKSSARTVGALAAAGILFLPFYETRIRENDAVWSAAWRGLTIETGFKIFADHPLLGAGPGYVSDPTNFSRYFYIPPGMRWIARMGTWEQIKGVDSTPVRLLAEGGLLGIFLCYYPLLVFWPRARGAAMTDEWRPLFNLALTVMFSELVSVGYRDLAPYLLPSILFTVAHAGNVEEKGNFGRSGSGPLADRRVIPAAPTKK